MSNIPPENSDARPLSAEGPEYGVVWEGECEGSPPCIDLISDPEGVLANKERWPDHLCYGPFRRQSTELWAAKCVGVVTQGLTRRWMGLYPLPIGRKAVMAEGQLLGDGVEELFNVVPFDGHEEALWALRIERRQPTAVHTLDLFGLVEYPTKEHRAARHGVAGGLAFVLRGHDKPPIALLDSAERLWATFHGRVFRGRPKGTGTWEDREHFAAELERAGVQARLKGKKVTQENVAPRLNTSARQLRAWIRYYGLDWKKIKRG